MIRIGNAPCSWGTLEFEGLEGERIGYVQMLDELCEAGYIGSDLGDWGFMPTDPAALHHAFATRQLGLIGAFVPVALRDPQALAAGIEVAVRVARLQAAAAPTDAYGHRPWLVLADTNGTDPIRTKLAGRVTAEQGLGEHEWAIVADAANQVAKHVRDATGLRTVFHHHCAGFVETPAELDRFMELTDPELIGLVLDGGHLVYGSGGCDGSLPVRYYQRYADRIGLIHFKDCHAEVAAAARAEGLDYFAAVQRGVFCELGQGCVDFAGLTAAMREHQYHGWVVVEQDVLPGMGTPKASAARNRAYVHSLGL
ncbi:MAG: sugar phosphate isomerase/epimerase [Roseiflexaceae bacterium]